MNKKDLKKKIRLAFAQQTPDIRSKVEQSCEREEQASVPAVENVSFTRLSSNVFFKRAIAFAMCLIMFVSGFSVGFFVPDRENFAGEVDSFVYLDVNPSIELQIDEKNRIVSSIAGNSDAELILAELELYGVEMDTALTAIIGSMYVNGYLTTDSNSILVSVDASDDLRTEALLTGITDKINSIFDSSEMECSIIAQGVSVDKELKKRANENGVSVGKMHLVEKMVEGMESFAEDDAKDLSNMSIRELDLIYSTRPDKEKDSSFGKDIVSGNVGGFVKKDDILSVLLDNMGLKLDEIEKFDIGVKLQAGDKGKNHMVYTVTIILKGDATRYEYQVDCLTGEVISSEQVVGEDRSNKDNVQEQSQDKGKKHENVGGGFMDDQIGTNMNDADQENGPHLPINGKELQDDIKHIVDVIIDEKKSED